MADALDISLASVKRILNADDIQMSRLIQIAKLLGLDLYELIESSRNLINTRSKLSIPQERLLSSDFSYFKIFRLVVLGKENDEISKEISISETNLTKKLLKLEKEQLIQVLPYGKTRALLTFPFEWIPNGPLEKEYTSVILEKVFKRMKSNGLVNHSAKISSNRLHIKEFYLEDDEAYTLNIEIKEIIKKYETITKLRLKNNKSAKVYSSTFFVGEFSLWD